MSMRPIFVYLSKKNKYAIFIIHVMNSKVIKFFNSLQRMYLKKNMADIQIKVRDSIKLQQKRHPRAWNTAIFNVNSYIISNYYYITNLGK